MSQRQKEYFLNVALSGRDLSPQQSKICHHGLRSEFRSAGGGADYYE